MAGIYFHIPFCQKKCTYCDFYKSTNTDLIDDYLNAVSIEIELQRDYLEGDVVETIYFGGGTPSLLKPVQLAAMLSLCRSVFEVKPDAEITVEANPDDLNFGFLEDLRTTGVNRLSIGVQSFSDTDLQFMGRRHNAQQAVDAVVNAQRAGFSNISLDLIYGVPGMPFEQWEKNLQQVFDLKVQHLSAYHLTYHKGTKLWKALQTHKISEVSDDVSEQQFNVLVNKAVVNGFEQYEISNFAVNRQYSKHNTSYWQRTKYLGLGPSAHSYNQQSRQWNVASVKKYIDGIKNRKVPSKIEMLTINDHYNEFVMTGLRTMWGVDTILAARLFGEDSSEYLFQQSEKYVQSGHLVYDNNTIKLTQKGILLSDAIMVDLMM
ncbi:MAG TPA: radical SAM family heme chaperone HemW [Prolixibacteraceae bacterium]|nr:radical SAM family heme chaperone HemW [Prolixibacteraceae bacterium]HPR59799.1 radical SAM family heme chaperone HemW [Prolixibacteraceae bacterium]